MPADRPPSPGPLIAARTVAVLQTVIGLVAAVLGGLAAASSAAHDRADASYAASCAASCGAPYGGSDGWRGVATAVFATVAIAGLVTVVVLGVPLLVLRSRTPGWRQTGRGLLIAGELLLLLPFLVVLYLRFGRLPLGTDVVSLVIDAFMLVPIAVIACLLPPSVNRWARGVPAVT